MDTQLISSIAKSNKEAIHNIMTLHNIERFDLDCTYSKGAFWKDLPQPIHKTDLVPQREDVIYADSTNLPFDDKVFNSIMFDPPFVITGSNYKENKEGSSIIAKRFEGYTSFADLKSHYFNSIKEAYRVLDDGGKLVIKCQDTVSSGKNHFSHCMVMQMALIAGFYPKDLFILTAKNRLIGGNWTKQYHARKFHSYFWVFEKTTCKIDYEIFGN